MHCGTRLRDPDTTRGAAAIPKSPTKGVKKLRKLNRVGAPRKKTEGGIQKAILKEAMLSLSDKEKPTNGGSSNVTKSPIAVSPLKRVRHESKHFSKTDRAQSSGVPHTISEEHSNPPTSLLGTQQAPPMIAGAISESVPSRQEPPVSTSEKTTDHASDTLTDVDISDLSGMLRAPARSKTDPEQMITEAVSISEIQIESIPPCESPSPNSGQRGASDKPDPGIAKEAQKENAGDVILVGDSSNSGVLCDPSDLSGLLRAPEPELTQENDQHSDLSGLLNRPKPPTSPAIQNGHSSQRADSSQPPAGFAQAGKPTQPSQEHVNGAGAYPEIAAQPVVIQPAPMMVQVPSIVPTQIPGMVQNPESHTEPEDRLESSSRQAPVPVKLPEPNSSSESRISAVDKQSASDETTQSEDSSATSVPDSNSDADQSQTSIDRINQRRAAIRELFQTELDQARLLLRKKQTPTERKTPRAIRKIAGAIETLNGKDLEGLVKQLEAAGATQRPEAVDILRDQCGHGNKDVRKTCIEQLGRISTPASALALLPMLQDKAPELAVDAATRILGLGFAEVLRSVVALGALNVAVRPPVRDVLVEAPTDHQDDNIETLKRILSEPHSEKPEFPAFALQLLSALMAEDGLKIYQKFAKHDVEELRATAIEALATTDHKQNVRFFNKAMQDPKPGVQAAAALALSRLHSPKSVTLLIAGLKSPANRVRRNSASTLAGLEDPDQKIALAASRAVQNETDPATLDSLLEIISRGGTAEAIGTLKKFAHGDDAEARYRAIQSLRKLKHERSIEVLLPLLEHSDAKTRRASVEAIGKLGAKKASGQIAGMLREDQDEAVRAACARTLGDFGNVKAISALEEALEDSRSVQIQAVIAMGMVKGSDAIPALLAQLRSTTPEIRLHACNALGQIGGLKNTDKIEALLDDKEAMVRRAAESTLEKLGVTLKSSKAIRDLKRRLAGLGSSLVPNALLSLAPGKTGGLIAIGAVVILSGVVFLGSKAITMLSSPGSQFPVTRIASISVSTNGQTAYASRGNGVIDVWDLKEGTLLDRFKPLGRYAVLSNSAGDKAVLYSNSTAVLYEKEKGFSETTESSPLPLKGITGRYQPADQTQLWVSSNSGSGATLSLIDRETFAVSKSVEISESIPELFAINKDQTMVVVPMVKGLKLFTGKDLKPASRLLEVKALLGTGIKPGPVKAAAFNESGNILALACERALVCLELPEGKVVGVQFQDEIPPGDRLISLRFEGDTNDVTAISARGAMFRSSNDFKTSEAVPAADKQSLEHFSVTPDNSVFVYSAPASKDMVVADLKTGTMKHELKGKQ